MQCNQVEPLIGAWQDGELHAWSAWRVGRHVRGCAACAAEAESLTALNRTLQSAAPLGASAHMTTDPQRNTMLPPLALTLASATVVVVGFLLMTYSPAPSVPTAGTRVVTHKEHSAPRPIEVPSPAAPTMPTLPESEKRAAPRFSARKPELQRIAARKKPSLRPRPIRVSRKPSLLPPLTHPEWTGGSVRYVASLTGEEQQVEIISIEAEMPPADELKRLVEEKSEFIFVQASYPVNEGVIR